jgi:hypothetical protein
MREETVLESETRAPLDKLVKELKDLVSTLPLDIHPGQSI